MTFILPEQLANRVRAQLRAADQPTGAPGSLPGWRTSRDGWLDRLDPRDGLRFEDSDIRGLIDFLSEAGPSRASRRTPAEWSREVDALVPELLFVGQSTL